MQIQNWIRHSTYLIICKVSFCYKELRVRTLSGQFYPPDSTPGLPAIGFYERLACADSELDKAFDIIDKLQGYILL